ncbi:MAG: ubiquinol-cytochrome c reductase iron-sulfur subunit [candidate division Zixibacteria bacterium]|nr:ubiquinol-cytochrome c reductase iron-sulfur subunit [candidate division Zixibacteria bacterium]
MQYDPDKKTPPADITRRNFIDRVIGVAGTAVAASIVYPVVRFLLPPKSGEANVNQVKLPFGRKEIESEAKKAKTFRFGRLLGIIVLLPDGQLRALSAQCTHLDCTVQNRPDEGVLWCACHNGKYDLDGKNISGPPPRPLEVFAVNEVGGDIFVSKGSA